MKKTNKVYVFFEKLDKSIDYKTSLELRNKGAGLFFEKAGMPAFPVSYRLGKNGKPYFDIPGNYFNASHSENVYMCAYSFYEIGADIQLRTVRDTERIKNRFFTESEKNEDFFSVWVKKEACVKLSGEGISAFSRVRTGDFEAFYDSKRVFLYDASPLLDSNINAAACVASFEGGLILERL